MPLTVIVAAVAAGAILMIALGVATSGSGPMASHSSWTVETRTSFQSTNRSLRFWNARSAFSCVVPSRTTE